MKNFVLSFLRWRKCRKSIIHSFFLGMAIIVFSPLFVFAYTPPIGIPDPGNTWAGSTHPIDTPAPDLVTKCPNWPDAESAGCYYIDNTADNATDDNNSLGYPGKPRATVPEITYSAGSYVEAHGGPYTEQYLRLSFHGTSENPCWFLGTPGNMPIFPRYVYLRDTHYLFVDYIDFNGGDSHSGLTLLGSDDHVAVRNSQFRNKTYTAHSSGLGITPDLGGTINDIIVYRCNFENLGDWTVTDSDPDFHGITPNLWGRDSTTTEFNVWILNNTFYHLSGNGVQVNAGNWKDSYKYLHHIYIGKNTAHELRQDGFWVKQASDVILSENVVYNNREHGPQMGGCYGYQYRPNNLWIIYNTCYDANFGVRQSDDATGDPSNTSYIVGNIFYDITPSTDRPYDAEDPWRTGVAISLWTGGMHRYVVDNTIYNCNDGINAIQSGEGSSLEMSGNIISNITPPGYHVYMMQNVVNDADIDYTLMYGPGNAHIRWGSNSHEYTSLSSFKAGEQGECLNCPSEADPLFVDAAGHDFSLKVNSPAIPLRGHHQVYTTFLNRYGIDISNGQVSVPPPGGGEISPPSDFILVH